MVTVLDPHFSPVTPSSRKDDYMESTEEVFRQVIRFAKKMEAVAILIAGDIFHLKTASRNPPWFLRRILLLFKEAREEGVEIWGIAGNHDLTFGSLVSVSTQPIGVLLAAGAMHLLDENCVLVRADGFSVKVAGCSYEHAKAAPVRDLKKDGSDHLVALGHFWFGKETGEFFGEPVYGPDYFASSEVDAFVIGHHHADQGIQDIGGRKYFAHGSMNRVGAHAGDMTRRPAVGLLEVTKEGVVGKIARLKVPEASEIFDFEKHQALVAERKELDQFLEMVASQQIAQTDVEGVLTAMSLPQEVRKRVDEFIQSAEAEIGAA